MIHWGIDLGGTKIECAVIDSTNGLKTIHRHRVATEGDKGYDHIVSNIVRLINIVKTETGLMPEKIGIGTPGAIEPSSRLMKNCNSTALNGRPLRDDLEKILQFPVNMANDANCFALAEANLGAVKAVVPDAKVVFGIILGTGVGGGIVVNGEVLNGRHGIGGEWGHNFLDESGGKCYCGRVGCVETVLSGPFLQRFYTSLTGKELLLPEIAARHQAGNDAAATATIERLLTFFGKAIAPVINIIDPDAIVIGGGVGNIDLLYTDSEPHIKKYLFNPILETKILKPSLGDSAGVFGAALL
jgi:fructokinase